MAETDPFGRDKSEDPLAEMGWATTDALPAGEAEIAAPEPPDRAAGRQQRATAPAPSRRPAPGRPPQYTHTRGTMVPGGIPGPRRRSRLGCAFAFVVLLFIGSIGAAVVPAVIDAIDEVEKTIDESSPEVPTPAERDDGPADRREREVKPKRPPSGLSGASMLRRGNLSPALGRLQRLTKTGRVRLIRIDARNVIVQVARGGGTVLAQATWDGKTSVLSRSPGGGGGTTFSWSQIDASAPNRVVRAVTRGRKTSSFDYLALIDAAGLRWSAFLKGGGGTFSAAPDGSGVSKVG